MSYCYICGDDNAYRNNNIIEYGSTMNINELYVGDIFSTVRDITDKDYYFCDKCADNIDEYYMVRIKNFLDELNNLCCNFSFYYNKEINLTLDYNYRLSLFGIDNNEKYRRFIVLHKFVTKHLVKSVDDFIQYIDSNILNLTLEAYDKESIIVKMKESKICTFSGLSFITKVNQSKISRLSKKASFDFKNFKNLDRTLKCIKNHRYIKV